MDSPFIEFKNIVKIFPPDNVALNNISVDVHAGEIHSFIGENGAGKSTLMKTLFGLEKPSDGEIRINGERSCFSSPQEAVTHGIGMVHQELMLIQEYTVLENIVLGNEPRRGIFLHMNPARKKLDAIIAEFHFDIPLDEKVKNLSIAAQQKIEIVKLLYREVHTLILDEPTAVLAPQEADELFLLLERIKKEGKTVLFISHKLDEVLRISDRITVMRQGDHIWTKENKNLTKTDLARAMVGRDVLLKVDKTKAKPGGEVLSVDGLCVENASVPGKLSLDNVSFKVANGEIVGIAGVEGNGQYELVQSVMGLCPSTGEILLSGENISKADVRARRRRIAYVSQDRKICGSSLTDSIEKNSLMTHHYVGNRLSGRFGLLSQKKCREFSCSIISSYQVLCQGSKSALGSLSGGNQQKVIVGREFSLDAPLLVVDQPVRGLDVGSIEYIHKRIVEKRDEGCAVLLVSADLDELFNLSDRILVLHKGHVAASLDAGVTNKEEVGEYMLGVR